MFPYCHICRSVRFVIGCSEVDEELFGIVGMEDGVEVGFNVESECCEFCSLGSPASQPAFRPSTSVRWQKWIGKIAHTIRSLMSMFPGSCVGTERKDATDINPSRIMIYVVAREVMLLSRWTVEYILGYWGMPLYVYCVVLFTAYLSCTRS
jgi:hypothetical protein